MFFFSDPLCRKTHLSCFACIAFLIHRLYRSVSPLCWSTVLAEIRAANVGGRAKEIRRRAGKGTMWSAHNQRNRWKCWVGVENHFVLHDRDDRDFCTFSSGFAATGSALLAASLHLTHFFAEKANKPFSKTVDTEPCRAHRCCVSGRILASSVHISNGLVSDTVCDLITADTSTTRSTVRVSMLARSGAVLLASKWLSVARV